MICAVLLLAACTAAPPMPDPDPTRSAPSDVGAWFVDCSRPAPGDGSRASPWSSIDAIAAHGAFAPGDRILLRRGSTCTGRIVPTGSGTSAAPILLGAYGSGPPPVVHGGGTADQTGTVQLTNLHDWVVQDLTVTNLDPAGPDNTMRAGILVANDRGGTLANILIRNNLVQHVTSSPGYSSADPHEYGGIAVLVRGKGFSGANTFTNVSITGNRTDQVGRTGIVAWSDAWPATPMTNVSITRNTLRDTEGDSVVLWGVDGGVIDHNVSDRGGHLPPCPRCRSTTQNTANAGIWPVMSRNILIQYNEVSGEGAAGGDGEGFDIDVSTEAVVLQGNYSHDNDGGGVLICGARDADVRYNILQNNGGGEITFSCTTQLDGVRIVNNTIHLGPDSSGQVVRHNRTSGADPVVFANNVVIDLNGGGYAWPLPVSAQGNLYAGRIPDSAPADATAVTDPGLVAAGTGGTGLDSVHGYTPTGPTAAASSGGVVVPGAGWTDFFGRSVDRAAPGRGAVVTGDRPQAFGSAAPKAVRTGADVTVTWPADRGTAYRLARSPDGRSWTDVSGLLVTGRFIDVSAPSGPLQYRLIPVGRDAESRPATAAVAG